MSIQEHKNYPALLLDYYIDQLAEYIVLDSDVLCALCLWKGSCVDQVSGLTCRAGIKAWLVERRLAFEKSIAEEIGKEFAYLDTLRSTGDANINEDRLQQQFPQWDMKWHAAVLQMWTENNRERTAGK